MKDWIIYTYSIDEDVFMRLYNKGSNVAHSLAAQIHQGWVLDQYHELIVPPREGANVQKRVNVESKNAQHVVEHCGYIKCKQNDEMRVCCECTISL